MSRIDPAGDELHSISGEREQEPLSTFVDDRDFVEVHNAIACHIRTVVLLPACFELVDPWFRKPAMKNPSFFRWCFTEIDLQHAVSLTLSTGRTLFNCEQASYTYEPRYLPA